MQVFNAYCDESCHLENDGIPVMAMGAVFCEAQAVRRISVRIRALKAEHGLKPSLETKWTKISPSKVDFYLNLVNLYLADDRLCFRGLVVPNKQMFNRGTLSQSHDEWHNSMYFTMLRAAIRSIDSTSTSGTRAAAQGFAGCGDCLRTIAAVSITSQPCACSRCVHRKANCCNWRMS